MLRRSFLSTLGMVTCVVASGCLPKTTVMTSHQLESDMTSYWYQGSTLIKINSAQCLGEEVDASGTGVYQCTLIDEHGVSHHVTATVNKDGTYEAHSNDPLVISTS